MPNLLAFQALQSHPLLNNSFMHRPKTQPRANTNFDFVRPHKLLDYTYLYRPT